MNYDKFVIITKIPKLLFATNYNKNLSTAYYGS